MAIGRRPEGRQEELFVATSDIRRLSHPFYRALERMLEAGGFDAFAEDACREFCADRRGRPSVPPGVYFRMLLVGYLEGIGSERGIVWRCADSISLREFLGCGFWKNPPDHSSVSRTRRRLSLEAHEAVFAWVLRRLRSSGLLSGKTLGVDSTTLEANAARRSIVRRDDGSGYEEWLEELARASGIATPTRSDLAKLDRKRPRKGSNEDWVHPRDPQARITKMKDGRTHLAHKLEQAADMDTGAIVAVTVQTMDGGDCASMPNTLEEAERQLQGLDARAREVVADKGYHGNATMVALKARGLRGYVSEPHRGSAQLEAQPRSPAADLRQPSPGSGPARQAVAAPARGEAGAGVRARAANRRVAPGACARAREHPQTRVASGGGFQSRAAHATAARRRHPAELARAGRGVGGARSPRRNRCISVHISRPGPPCGPLAGDCRPRAGHDANFASTPRAPTTGPRDNGCRLKTISATG